MSLSEEDIEATAKVAVFKTKSLLADHTHHFRSRKVLQVRGELSELSKISIGAIPEPGGPGQFVSLLDESGFLDADLFIVPHEDGALIDVHAELADHVADRLLGLASDFELDLNAGSRWRVLAETPNQKGPETPFESMRFTDSRRRELGTRIVRDAAEPEGLYWSHSRNWDGHAMRLGIIPDHRCILGLNVRPEEAGYHRLLGAPIETDPRDIDRRVLPIRVDTYSNSVPVMAGSPLRVADQDIGVMLDQEGVCGIALVNIEPWRQAGADGAVVVCQNEPILISWPTWLSSESEGRVGPAGQLI